MSDVHLYMLAAMAIPVVASIQNLLHPTQHNLRDGITFLAALATLGCVLMVLNLNGNAHGEILTLFEIMPGLSVAFRTEALGLVFAVIASGLWCVTHLYAVGYMRGNNEQNHARFFAAFSFSIGATLAIAFSANMFTLFLFYEVLSLATYPLVAHKGNDQAKRGARTYLGILLGTSIGLQLVAIIWTWSLAGTLDFTQGGVLDGKIGGTMAAILLGVYAFGIGKAALMPFHRWLPAAMVAPTPVSALLHAVAVVKAGVFTMMKVGVYIFGLDFLAQTGAADWLVWWAGLSIVLASVIAITQKNLKARLAYSTVSQLSYITLGMALATSWGALGGALHIVTHAVGKITLFMCAGAIYVATHRTEIPQLQGLGRAMPFTFGAFLVGALSIIGLPPLAGAWSKWEILVGAADTGDLVVFAVLIVSSLLNIAYLVPIVSKAFFVAPKEGKNAVPEGFAEAPILCVMPPVFTAACCFAVFFYAGEITAFLEPITLGNDK